MHWCSSISTELYACGHYQVCSQEDVCGSGMSLGPIFDTILMPIRPLEITNTLIWVYMSVFVISKGWMGIFQNLSIIDDWNGLQCCWALTRSFVTPRLHLVCNKHIGGATSSGKTNDHSYSVLLYTIALRKINPSDNWSFTLVHCLHNTAISWVACKNAEGFGTMRRWSRNSHGDGWDGGWLPAV